MDCLFCKISTREIPAEIIYEDDTAVAFLDIQPSAPGHALVIPKHHAGNLTELPDEAAGPFFRAVKNVVRLVEKALAPDGFTLGINHGALSGQEVMHLHLHVIPRWASDGGRAVQGVVNNQPTEDIKAIGEKIRAASSQIKS